MTGIVWGKKARPRKSDGGHSAVQYGHSERDPWHIRSYVRCECGTRLSGHGTIGGQYSYVKHARREAAKAAAQPV